MLEICNCNNRDGLLSTVESEGEAVSVATILNFIDEKVRVRDNGKVYHI